MTYYQLRCADCEELFKPLVATSSEELLYPDFSALLEECPCCGGHHCPGGSNNFESLKRFHEAHRRHHLETQTCLSS